VKELQDLADAQTVRNTLHPTLLADLPKTQCPSTFTVEKVTLESTFEKEKKKTVRNMLHPRLLADREGHSREYF
jgi:hypothetical protein